MRIGLGLILGMAAATYLLRLAGLALSHRDRTGPLAALLPLIPAALLAGLVVTNGFTREGGGLVIDERAGGMVVAALLAWQGRGIGTVVVGGVVTTGAIRLVRSLVGM